VDLVLGDRFSDSVLIGFTNRPKIKQGWFGEAVCVFRYSFENAILDGYLKPGTVQQHTLALEGFCIRFLQQFSKEILHMEMHCPVDFCFTVGQRKFWVGYKSYRSCRIPLQILDKAIEQMRIFMRGRPREEGLLLLFGRVPDEYKKARFDNDSITIWDISNILYYVKDSPELFAALANLTYFPIEGMIPLPPYGWAPPAVSGEAIGEPASLALEKRLRECGTGKKYAQAYEEICGDIIQYLFGEEFTLYSAQHKTGDDLFRMDILCSLKGTNAFWKLLIQHYNTRFVVFEFKNYAAPLQQNLIFITEKYLFHAALRNVAIIISRKGFSGNAKTASEGCLKESGKLILDITDEDLVVMLKKKDDGEEPSDYLLEKLEHMLMSISK